MAKLDKLQCEVEASQASTSQEVMAKMNKKAYHFKKKGNEAQFIFNSTVEDHIDAAKKTLGKMAPNSDADKASLEKATTELDQGKEAIRVWQKHIRIANLSDIFFFFFKGKSTKYSYNTNYSTTKLQTQLITTAVWGKENQSPHTAKPSTVKSYGHCSSIKKLKVVRTGGWWRSTKPTNWQTTLKMKRSCTRLKKSGTAKRGEPR